MTNQKLLVAAAMAMTMAEIFPAPRGSRERRDSHYPSPVPPPQRNVMADAEAIEKAEAKRQRKAAKRRAEVGAGNTANKRSNEPAKGRAESASSE